MIIVHRKKQKMTSASVNRELPALRASNGLTQNQSVYSERMRGGQILILGIAFMAVVLILSASLFSRVSHFIGFSATSVSREQAANLAEAAIDKALWQLNQTAGAYTGETNTQLGSVGTFSISIANKSANVKTITATGYVPKSINPTATRIIKVDAVIDTTQIAFRYAVQVGSGGLSMANSSIINGSVYTNGNITGSGSSIINGDAYAVGTISSPDPTVLGTTNPNQSSTELPVLDYQIWKDAAVAGGIIDCATTPAECDITDDATIGPKKYLGNLTIENNAIVTINGPIWATGNLTVSQGGTEVKLAEIFGSSGTVIICDGLIAVTQGGQFKPTTANPKGYIYVVTTSANSTAISIGNSGANAVFYALAGGADLSQTATVNSIVAASLSLQNNANLTYDSGLASATLSTGPGASWQLKRGTYKNY